MITPVEVAYNQLLKYELAFFDQPNERTLGHLVTMIGALSILEDDPKESFATHPYITDLFRWNLEHNGIALRDIEPQHLSPMFSRYIPNNQKIIYALMDNFDEVKSTILNPETHVLLTGRNMVTGADKNIRVYRSIPDSVENIEQRAYRNLIARANAL